MKAQLVSGPNIDPIAVLEVPMIFEGTIVIKYESRYFIRDQVVSTADEVVNFLAIQIWDVQTPSRTPELASG